MEKEKDYILEYLILQTFISDYLRYEDKYFSLAYRELLKKLNTFYDKNNIIYNLINGNITKLSKKDIDDIFAIRNFLMNYIYNNNGIYLI